MAKSEFDKTETGLISEALESYGAEVKKLMKKAEKLGLPEGATLKATFLEIEALRNRVSGE